MSTRVWCSNSGSFCSFLRVLGLSVGLKSIEVGPDGNHGTVWPKNHRAPLATGPNDSRRAAPAALRISPST